MTRMDTVPEPPGIVGWIGIVIGLGCMVLVIGTPIYAVLHPRHVVPHSKPAVSPLSNQGYAYWYCWDAGDPRPHHLGAPVPGDHVCSEVELQQATETP